MRMRHLIKIQQDTSNDTDEAETWTTWKNDVPANVTDVRGIEKLRGVQIAADVDAVIETRWYRNLTPKMRIVHDTRTYDIKSALDKDGRQRYLMIQATEVQ